ncbi:Arc domain-containing protein [uncultured Bradyrhizobium sp.]|uniref:Arc domain-containing protein n=1 Tax=Bradyrhizobium sp. TaxID=376 RepID=UPI00262D428D|nr:Arc domain-containing protein [uncultured Bradyrhizobium sp.]
MHKSKDCVPMIIRVPADVRLWLEVQAKQNISSMTSEIVRAVRDRMHAVRERERLDLEA